MKRGRRREAKRDRNREKKEKESPILSLRQLLQEVHESLEEHTWTSSADRGIAALFAHNHLQALGSRLSLAAWVVQGEHAVDWPGLEAFMFVEQSKKRIVAKNLQFSSNVWHNYILMHISFTSACFAAGHAAAIIRVFKLLPWLGGFPLKHPLNSQVYRSETSQGRFCSAPDCFLKKKNRSLGKY